MDERAPDLRGMNTPTEQNLAKARRSPFILWAVLLLLAAAAQALLVANRSSWHDPSDAIGIGASFAVTYGLAAALILSRRPGHPIGRLFFYVTAVMVAAQLTGEYAIYAYVTAPSGLPLREFAAWISNWAFFLAFPFGLTMLFLLFPDGLSSRRRWRALAILAIVGGIGLTLLFMTTPGHLNPAVRVDHVSLPVSNPTGIAAFNSDGPIGILQLFGWPVSALAVILSVISPLARLRRATGERRQQLKWFAYFAAPVAPAFAIHFIIRAASLPVADLTQPIYQVIYLFGVPVATGIAILRYKLYDIDVVISRALVFGSLAALITAVYVGIAVGVGSLVGSGGKPNLGLSILATAIVAVGFQPVRERLQRVANRLVYGERATPYEVLSQFSERVAESYATDEVMPRMARVLAEGTGAQRADIWLRSGGAWREAAVWPADAPPRAPVPAENGTLPSSTGDQVMVPVRHQGDLLGALSVTKRGGETLTPVEANLLTHLAGQAGLVLKNVGLSDDLQARLDDLRASRQRLVTAQDEERRRLERNLHDGAQQHLVAIKVKLGLAEMLMKRDPAKAEVTLDQLKSDADEALQTLRDLARGIYPPLLADKGLAVALESQARKATVPVILDVISLSRYSQEVEAAVYFCCLEAMQNMQKYAHASKAVIRLREVDAQLHFEIEDDGDGFDVATTSRGAGLNNMVDRFDALGGELHVASTVGKGTRIHGLLPVGAGVAVDQAVSRR
ncbi:MAG: GAF domain-containing sensor histidine kinase [Candidatus Dormibacteraeota bacterium]|uniref:histidine kinase n=1 Tax=Candidatus Amunia macphersoniae TaxID=3127014 RepID=A0A934KRI9_9BACT|nr:GAF domain-containing sensor histidine kinase [Candidatus Dormibacteraeota bacterium]